MFDSVVDFFNIVRESFRVKTGKGLSLILTSRFHERDGISLDHPLRRSIKKTIIRRDF